MKWTKDQKLLMALVAAILVMSVTIYATRYKSINVVEASINYSSEIGTLKAEIAHLKKEITRLETADKILANDLLFRTDPEQVDINLRTYFDSKLRNDPDQVRGMDGKLPKERSY